jgi:hypothetical protein
MSLEMSLLYANVYFREHFISNQSTQKGTKLNELFCKHSPTSFFSLEGMVIEVKNLIHDGEFTRTLITIVLRKFFRNFLF